MSEIFNFLNIHGQDLTAALTAIVSGASVLANFTRTDKDNRAVGVASVLIHVLAGNFFALPASPQKTSQK